MPRKQKWAWKNMFLNRLTSLLLISSTLGYAGEARPLQPFLENTSQGGSALPSALPKKEPSSFILASSLPKLAISSPNNPVHPKVPRIEVDAQYLGIQSIEFVKYRHSLHKYGIIPWRITKNISFTSTKVDAALASLQYPIEEEAPFEEKTQTFFGLPLSLPKLKHPIFILNKKQVICPPLSQSFEPPAALFSHTPSSYFIAPNRYKISSSFLTANNPLREKAFASIIRQKVLSKQPIPFPNFERMLLSFNIQLSGDISILSTIGIESPTLPALLMTSPLYSYRPASADMTSNRLKKEPTLSYPYRPTVGRASVEPIFTITTTPQIIPTSDLFFASFRLAGEPISLANENTSLFSKREIHILCSTTQFFSNPEDILIEIEKDNCGFASKKAITEQLDFYPKKTFLFLEVPHQVVSLTFPNSSVDMPEPSIVPKKLAVAFVPTSYFHAPNIQQKAKKQFVTGNSFLRYDDALHIPFHENSSIFVAVDGAHEESETILKKSPFHPIEKQVARYDSMFDVSQLGIEVYPPSNFIPVVATTRHNSKSCLSFPSTQYLSNVLFDDESSSQFIREERIEMMEFGKSIGKTFASLFPSHLSQPIRKTIPTNLDRLSGVPPLKDPRFGISYNIDASKHINNGYRLTSYNLTRLPTPDELNIDEYMESLSTRLEVLPRKDGTGYYFSLTLVPKHEEELTKTPQNVVFFLDRTSSILAPRYDSYRNGVMRSLRYLNEGDTFNIVVIDSKLHYFEEKPVPVTRSALRRARRFLQDLPFPKLKKSNVDLYDLLYELQDFFVENGNVNTGILVSDGLSLYDIDHKAKTLRTILDRNQGKVTLHCAASGGKNNSAMLDLLSTFHAGEFAHSHSVASFPRKLARLVKKTNALLSNAIHITTVYEDHTLDIDLYNTNDRMPHFYSGKPFTIYGSINKLDDFKIVIQGKVGSRFMHYAKDISFKTALKSPSDLYRLVSINKAYACYNLFLKEGDPNYLREAKALLQKYKLPAATKKRAATNEKNLMRERFDFF